MKYKFPFDVEIYATKYIFNEKFESLTSYLKEQSDETGEGFTQEELEMLRKDFLYPPEQVKDNLWLLMQWSCMYLIKLHPISVFLGGIFLLSILAANFYYFVKSFFA